MELLGHLKDMDNIKENGTILGRVAQCNTV
jgi:hypothetical protein